MKKIRWISMGLIALFAMSTLTSCQVPKKKPKCLALKITQTFLKRVVS